MKDVLIHFEANEVSYPLAFNINVLEVMQDKFGSFTAFADSLSSKDGDEPKMKDIKFIYTECINEGIDMENDPDCVHFIKSDETRPFLTEKQVGRLIGSITDKAGTIKQLVVKSNDSGKEHDEDEEKNLMTGQ